MICTEDERLALLWAVVGAYWVSYVGVLLALPIGVTLIRRRARQSSRIGSGVAGAGNVNVRARLRVLLGAWLLVFLALNGFRVVCLSNRDFYDWLRRVC